MKSRIQENAWNTMKIQKKKKILGWQLLCHAKNGTDPIGTGCQHILSKLSS